jgi:hypothetical protein
MHSEIEDMRSALAASAEREAALLRLLDAARDTDREGRLLDLLVHARQETDHVRAELQARPQPPATLDATPRPVTTRERSPLHTAIIGLLAHHPDGLSAAEIASAVHTSKSLGDMLCGMVRRGHVTRPRSGVYALPVEPGVHAVSVNGVEP